MNLPEVNHNLVLKKVMTERWVDDKSVKWINEEIPYGLTLYT